MFAAFGPRMQFHIESWFWLLILLRLKVFDAVPPLHFCLSVGQERQYFVMFFLRRPFI